MDIQSHGLVTGKRGEQSFAGICVHMEAEREAQRRWTGTEQEERDAPTREVTQAQRRYGKRRGRKVSVLVRSCHRLRE